LTFRFNFMCHDGSAGAGNQAARADAGERRKMALYRHTQTGAALRWGLILPAVGLFVLGFAARRAVPLVPLAALLAATGWAFSSLTIEVTPTRLIWFFGPGLLRKSIDLKAILGVTPVRNPWWYGWGVHLTPRGWLYNVGGLDAVELTLSSGTTLRIGSDEAAALARALM
jgi:hypothetical protein